MKKTPKKQLVGKWRIVHMDDFTKKDIDEEVPAFIEVERGGTGEFQFILVRGAMCGDFKNNEVFDFTWDGSDECDKASGDGWMKIRPDGGTTAEGEIRFHCGDSYKFQAVRAPDRKKANKKFFINADKVKYVEENLFKEKETQREGS